MANFGDIDPLMEDNYDDDDDDDDPWFTVLHHFICF